MPEVRFTDVTQITEPLNISVGISGGSGSGKTFTALRMARGMAQAVAGPGAKIGFVDTENRRALHYRDAFPEMMHFDMRAVDDQNEVVGFGPERWISVIDAAEDAGLPVLVMDSFSHAWEGVGGVLDLHAETLDRLTGGDESQRDKRSQLAWAHVKPRYRRLVDRIVRAKPHIVICTRAKPVMQTYRGGKEVNARKTKTRRPDVPWDPAADGDLMFEMTAMVILDPVAPGCPVHQIKVADQFKTLFDARQRMGEELGVKMVEWAQGGGDAAGEKQAMDNARAEAAKGRDALSAFWKKCRDPQGGIPENRQRAIWRIMDELKVTAAEADVRPDEMGGELFDGDQQDRSEDDVDPKQAVLARMAARVEAGEDPDAIAEDMGAILDKLAEDDLAFAKSAEAILSSPPP